MKHSRLFISGSLFLISACSRPIGDCGGPPIDYDKARSIRAGLSSLSGPKTKLLLPNPVEISGNPHAQIDDPRVASLATPLFLTSLLSPTRLESAFIKMRVQSIADQLSLLATPNAQGDFIYPPESPHYSEALGYYSLELIQNYIEALGFGLNKSRPLYAMVEAVSSGGSIEANAFYDHSKFAPSQPHTMSFFGKTAFKVSKDRDMFWHEFGHFVNESLSSERGIDLAGDLGAEFTEGAALHECLADYGAESLARTPHIGKWIARNFSGYEPGQPLRSAVDTGTSRILFSDVVSEKFGPDRYSVAEWCSRVLWRIRTQLVEENPTTGEMDSDRMVYGAISLLGRDASVSQFRSALLESDDRLQCGIHRLSIETAFADGGFEANPAQLGTPLLVKVAPSLITSSGSAIVAFDISIQNSLGGTARNLRVSLESLDGRMQTLVYLQGYGDLVPGGSIVVSASNTQRTVTGSIANYVRGARIPYRIRVLAENAEDQIIDGEIP